MSQPNIVVVLVDQMRRDALSCAGDPNVATPHLDALAARGIRFTAANATFPACVPFRFSLMTGHYAHSRNVPALGFRLSPAERTLGEAMQAAGYRTGWIGKWHLYSAYGVSGGLTLSQAARTPVPASHRRGFEHWQGFELRNDFHDSWVFDGDASEPRRLPGHQTDALFDLAFEHIRSHGGQKPPFFLVLSIEAPHPPFMATPEHLARRRARGPYISRPNTDISGISFFPPEWSVAQGPAGAVDPDDPASVERVFETNMLAYCAMIEQIDDNMGRLGAVLDAQGIADETVVVFLSDHGELGGSHGCLGKAQPFEESVGIPLIVAGPDIPACRSSNLPLATEDIFPTLVGLGGGPVAGDLPGLDISGLIRGGPEPDREGVLLEFVTETRPGRSYHDETWRGLRTRRHKYTVIGDRAGAPPWQLFDLEADPYERTNLLTEPTSERLAGELHSALARCLDAAGDDFALAPAFGRPGRACVAP